jgi:GNAT superfamily N-acetyltransferase
MNEQAINDAYSLFSSKGYNGSVEDFKNLIATNPNALDDAYKLFASKGYNGSIDGFSELMGLKKKEPSVSTSQEGAMAPATEDGSLASQESAPVLDFTKLRQEQQVQQYGELPTQPKTESMLSPEAKAQVDERIKRGEVQVAPVVKAEEPVGVSEKLAYLWDSGVNVLSDLSQNVRQSVMGLDRASVYEFVDKNRDQFPELYNEYTKLKGQGASDADAAYGAYLQMVAMDPTLETRVNSFVRSKDKEKLREEIGSDLSKEQREKLSSDLVTSALGGLVESTPAMLSSGSTYGLSFFDMAYKGAEDMLAQEFEQNPELKLTAAQQEEYKLASGAVMAVLEKVGLSNTIKANPLIRRALTARVLSSMAGLGKKAGSEAFEKVVKKELGTLARVSKGIGSGFVAEAETGALQELAQNGLNYYVNETSGKTVFDGKSATELIKDVLRAGIAEGIGGGFIGGVVNVFANPDAITEEEFAKARTFASEVDIKKVQQHLAEEMSAGKMSKEEASRILNNINEFRAVANSVPDDVSSEAQAKIFKLIKEKQDISKSVAGKDEAIQAVAKEQIKAIDENIKELYVTSKAQPQDAVKEEATDEEAVVPDEIQSLNDDEIVTFTVESLDQVPDEFRDRAEKKDGTEIEIRKTILGLPIGEKTTKVVNSGYTYTLTGKEAKDYAIQKQATDESVLRAEQPEVGLQEVGERDQEPQVAAEEEVGTVGTLLNERVVYDDPVSGQPVEGDLFVEGQRVVLEAAGGQQFDLGNVDDVLAQPLDGGIVRPAEMAIMPQEDGSFVFNKDGNQKVAKGTQMFNNQPGLQAITRDDAGNVKRVTLYSEDGTETYNLTGQEAEDAAYYIVRGFVETQEGQDAINQLAERNEEARRDLTKPIGVRPVQQVAPQAAAQVRAEAPAGPVVEGAEADVDAQELADLAADMQAATPARRERLERVAKRARAAVSRILPDVKIIVHDTQEAYRAATTFEGEATYNNDTKTIHINGTKATPAAVAHEVFHAVFLDKVKTDAKAQAVAKKMVESLKRVLGENSEAYQYLDEFSKDYDANFQNEEKLAEMVAVLSELYSGVNDIGLSPSAVQSVKNTIKKFITDLAKLFNIPMATTLTDADVLAVLNTIAQKAVTGEVITEADVQTIDRVMAEDIESVESFFVNTELETPPAVEIKPRQRVSAQTNEEARESLERKGRKMFPSSTDDALTSDEVRVYFMDEDFNWVKRFSVPYEDVANVFAEMASDPDFHLFPSITMQGGFMTMDTSKGRAEMETNIKISPRDENTIYIEGIELFDPKLAGEGVGTKLMNRILAAADKFGLTIQLDAYPTRRYQYDQTKGRDFSDRQLDKMADRLVTDFYSKFGFSSLDIRTKELARFMERKPMASASSVQMRERKGLITITEREAQKYARIGINDARVAQAMEDLGLAGVKFTKGDVETAISKAFDKAIDELSIDMYNGQPAVITQDSPGITNAIQAEITALEEQGASLSRIESAKQMVNDPGTRNEYIRKYQDTQKETLAQWVSYLEQSDYDPAFKMLMLDAVVTSNYDYKLEKYFKRNSTTIRNMAPFDAGTLAELYGMTENKELLKTYAEIQADNASRVVKANMMKSTKEGKWLKFAGGDNVSEAERETNANALSQLVQNTFWCTKTNAKSQLDGGDFYVYVTEGTDMRPIPRIAVRMDGSDVGELRGNASSKQDLEPEMLPVAEKFLKEEIPGGSGQTWLDSIAFNKKAKAFAESIDGSTLSMNMINEFAKLSSESAKYNVDYGKNGFIERIEESIKAKVKAGDVTSELDGVIETSLGDANTKTKIFIGNVRRGFYDRLQNVEVVIGDVTIDGTDIAPFSLRVITGDLDLGNNIQSLSNIETVGGKIYFGNSINTLEDLGKIEVINGAYSFSPPTRVKTFDYLKTINGDFNIERSSFLESLGSLEVINGSLRAGKSDLNSLGNLKSVSSYAILPRGVKKIDGVSFGGRLELSDGVEIINVKTIPGDFVVYEVSGMESKHSATGSIEEIGGTALLHDSSSTSIGNIKRVGRGISLSKKITSLENLSHVNGNIGIYGDEIKSIDNLEYVGGDLTVYARKISSLGSVKHVGGDIEVSTLSAVKNLGKLEYVGGLIRASWNIEDTGELSSVGELWFGQFKNNTGEDVNIAAFAARYVQESGIYGFPIAEKVYELALKQASKYFGVELPPAPRQRKDSDAAYENWKNGPKSVAQEIGYKYNMNHKGYTPSNIVKQHFKNEVERLSSRLSIRSTITGSGYYMTLDGKFFNPYLKVIGGQDSGPNGLRQRMGQPNENIFDIVTMARQKGYTDKTIEIYLKQEGFAAQDIKDAMAVNSNIDGAQVPQEFGNVTGGMAQGQTLFDEIKAKLTKMAADGASMMDIRIEAQTLLMDSEVYKAQSVEVKAQLRLSLDATIGTKAADRAFRQEFKQLRAMLSDRKKARRELETIKRMMRGFIRKNLPQGEYSKAEVVALLKAIVDANVDTLPLVMEKVEGYVTGFKVRKLEKQIQKLIDTKTTGMVSGRQVGRVSVELQNQLAELNDKESPVLADDSMSEEAVESLMSNQIATYNRIMAQTYITEQEAAEAQLLSIAMMYNDAYMMEDTNPNKVETLQSVVENLAAMIATGRAEMRAELDQQRAQYKAMVAEAYSEITGEQLDMSDTEDAKAANKKKIREAKNIEEKKKNFRNRIKGAIGKMSSFVDNYFTRQMDLPLLLSRITSVITESFGGKLQETVDGRLFDARTEFTRRKMEVMKMLEQKQKEIFGKDYKNQMAMNVVPRFSKDIVTDADAVFTDMTEADELRKEYKSANDKRRKAIVARLTDLEIELSPNQDYYLYNQYKDPANRASFIEKFGEDNYAKAMEIITNRLDPKVKEWADWQVNELFPSLYEAYNEVYRAVYRTNMPWNQFYAGRIYREGKEGDNTFDLLQGSTEYRTSVGGQSTKARIRNQRPIENMDGNSALNSYLEDMEYFRAYAEVMRDMNKLFENPNIEDAINKTAGSNTHRALKDMMGRIAARGVKGSESQVVNGMINNYIVSKLGFNPTIMVKQLTSAIAFSDYIGWGNWSLYMAKAMPDAKSLWKEWYDNSPVLQERYENSNMGEVLEGYNRTAVAKTSPVLLNKKLFGKDVTILDSDVAKWQNSLMYLIKVGDKGGVMGGLANYLYYKDEFKAKNPNATEQQAIDYASRKATRQAVSTQQDSGITNKDWYQTSGPSR